jgi:hypothetical protein
VYERLLVGDPRRLDRIGCWLNTWCRAELVAIGCPLGDEHSITETWTIASLLRRSPAASVLRAKTMSRRKCSVTDQENFGSEQAGGASEGAVHTITITVARVSGPPVLVDCDVVDGRAVFEGDIILNGTQDPPQLDQEAVAITGDRFRWRNGVIPFEIDAALPNQARVTNAIAHWEATTDVRFRARTASDDSFVEFVPAGGCASEVGRRGGRQTIELGPNCGVGNTIHEIGHTVGLWHEQSREDRDRFITIDWSNIQPGKEHNFNQHITDGDDIGAYDYGSIMHYGAFAFPADPAVPTITAPQPIGQRTALSAGDIAAARALYYFRRLSDSADLAGGVSEIATVGLRPQQVLTAVRTDGATLKLISWRVGADGAVTRTGDSGDSAGDAQFIGIANALFPVTACRAKNGDLKLISWDVNASGAISRLRDSGSQAGEATLIRVVALTDTLLVTACRAGNGTLKLITWRLDANGSIDRLRDSGNLAGAVSEIAVTALGPRLLATSVRAANGTLKVIAWDIAPDGTVSRRGDSGDQAGEARMIQAVRNASGHLITSVRAGNGRLKLITWNVAADGRTVARAADSGDQAGDIEDNALLSRAPGAISAVRADNGNLKLIAWRIDAAGGITRAGDSYDLAGDARLITLAESGDPIVTAVRTANGNLKLITWDN